MYSFCPTGQTKITAAVSSLPRLRSNEQPKQKRSWSCQSLLIIGPVFFDTRAGWDECNCADAVFVCDAPGVWRDWMKEWPLAQAQRHRPTDRPIRWGPKQIFQLRCSVPRRRNVCPVLFKEVLCMHTWTAPPFMPSNRSLFLLLLPAFAQHSAIPQKLADCRYLVSQLCRMLSFQSFLSAVFYMFFFRNHGQMPLMGLCVEPFSRPFRKLRRYFTLNSFVSQASLRT